MSDNPENKDSPLILVVDDEPDILNLIKTNLNRIGYRRLALASDGQQALDFVKHQVPDLILLDIMMPGVSGIRVCDQLKKSPQYHHIPIIMVSALGDLKNKAEAYKSGANDYLTKPVDVITMAARIRAILETRQLEEKVRLLSDNKAISSAQFDFLYLHGRILAELERCRRREIPFSLIYTDIDYMKMINLEFSDAVGDSVIWQVRNICRERAPEKAIIITSNGDKNLILLPGIGEGRVHTIADDIMDRVRFVPLPMEPAARDSREVLLKSAKGITRVGLSMGIVTWDKIESIEADKLLELTSRALRTAKEQGRGKKVQFRFYSQSKGDAEHKIDKTVVKDYGRKNEA